MSDQFHSRTPARPTQIYSPSPCESKELEPFFSESFCNEKDTVNCIGLYEPQSPDEKKSLYERPDRPRRGSVWTLSNLNPSYSLVEISKRYQLSPYRSSRSLPLFDCSSPLGGLQLSHSQRKYVPPLVLLSPVIIVLFCTAGMASLMLMWVYLHKLPLLSPGVIYLREGEENEIGRQYTDATMGDDKKLYFNEMSSHPTTLSLSSVVVFLIGWSLYPMMGLIAYGLAADWLQMQDDAMQNKDNSSLPISSDYALLCRICTSNGISSIFSTAKHWIHHKKQGRTIPAMLIKAVLWLFVLLTLQILIAWLDFTLHETTRTISVINLDKKTKIMPFSMLLNRTLCPSDRGNDASPCLYTPSFYRPDGSQHAAFAIQDPIILSKGWLTANEESDLVSVKTLSPSSSDEDSKEMMFYAHSKLIPSYFVDGFTSIGSSTQCEVMTDQCDRNSTHFDCSNIGLFNMTSDTLITSLNSTIKDNLLQVHGLYLFPNSTILNRSSSHSLMNVSGNEIAYSVFRCSVTIFDLTISYFNDSYTIEHSDIADVSTARDLSGPLLAGLLINNTFNTIDKVVSRIDQKGFVDILSQSLGFNVLAFSSGLIEQQSTTIRIWRSILAQQYDTSILFIYISLLYTYALVALILFFWAWATSSRCVVYQDDHGIQRELPMVVLTQRLLMDPSSNLISTFLGGKNRNKETDIALLGDISDEQIEEVPSSSGIKRRLKSDTAYEDRLYIGLDHIGSDFGVWPMSRRVRKC